MMQKVRAFKNVYFVLPLPVLLLLATESLFIRQMKHNIVILENHSKFEMQINSKLLLAILLFVENMQKPACTYSAASQPFKSVILVYHIDLLSATVIQAEFQA